MARLTSRQAEPPVELYGYLHERSVAASPGRCNITPITVSDDWPTTPPVTDQEARIIEAFFADVLDELFGPIP